MKVKGWIIYVLVIWDGGRVWEKEGFSIMC